MARFNGSNAQQGHPANGPARSDADSEGQVWTPEQVARWHQQQAQAAAAAPAARHQPAFAPLPPLPFPHHAQPGHASDPYAAQQDGWRHQEPQGHPGDPTAWGAQHAPSAHDRLPPLDRFDGPAGVPDIFHDRGLPPSRGYDQQAVDFGGRQPSSRPDDAGWNLGGYPAGQHAPQSYGAAPGQLGGHAPQQDYAPDPHGYPGGQHGGHDLRWPGGPGHLPDPHAGQHGYGDPPFEGSAHGQSADFQQPQYGFDANGQHHGFDGHQHDYADAAEEEPELGRRRPSAFVVAGALIGAIVLGGGMAYGYKQFTTVAGGDKQPPVVKADKSPAKAKPATPGGRDVAHTDKKFLNQLAENPPPATAESQPPADTDGGPRKVTTMVVGRDGSVAPPIHVAPPPGSGVPGMVLDVGPRPQLRGPTPAEPPPQQVAEADLRIAPRNEPPPPKARPEPPMQAGVSGAAPTATRPAAMKKTPAARDDAAIPASATASVAPAAVSAPRAASTGFVTVLASRKSRDEAFGMYPDLQVKYAEILSQKMPDVRETDLSAQGKGVVYRLILGPPGSKESAIDTCNKLKAQGFSGCWATPY